MLPRPPISFNRQDAKDAKEIQGLARHGHRG